MIQSMIQISAILMFGWMFSFQSLEALATEGASLDREVSIEFSPVPNAKYYEIRATKKGDTSLPPILFSIESSSFLKRLPLGSWFLEVRSFDMRGVAGRWEPMGDIMLGFRPPTIKLPSEASILKSSGGRKKQINFAWESFHPNAEFQFQVQDQIKNEIIVAQNVRGNAFTTELMPGKYRWILKSIVPRGIPLDGKDPDPITFRISAGQLEKPEIEKAAKLNPRAIIWKKPEHSLEFSIKLEKVKEERKRELSIWDTITSEVTSATTKEIPMDLEEGLYRFSIISMAPNFEPSESRSVTFKIMRKNLDKNKVSKDAIVADKLKLNSPGHTPIDFIQASVGPVFWNYSFASESGQKFEIVSGTVTAIDAALTKWFAKWETAAWGAEFRGRQTNIYLFEGGTSDVAEQNQVQVTDRRLAVLLRRRTIFNRLGVDTILGIGNHQYTYLIQDQLNSTIHPITGQLLEIYLGGALDWQFINNNHIALDLTFHPVGKSIGISADKTWQYTASIRYLKQALHDRSFLTLNIENFRSRVNTHSERFTGSAETISSWYRLGAGVGIKI